MDIVFDEKTGTPKFVEENMDGELSEKDFNDARAIKIMMETPGWKILKDYNEIGRESIIDAGKIGIRKKESEVLSAHKWAVLKGWDECSKMAEKICARAEDAYRKKLEEEEENDAGNESD